ncbi:unnamed protein product [Gongylonema pulchrum]|uniref:Similar to n=1 Tax=Gongylonema pulchrum TaxID=637853 RepID=A0A183E578_9BILA|nr:unnamed protein product [Gongylonema pulchrum]
MDEQIPFNLHTELSNEEAIRLARQRARLYTPRARWLSREEEPEASYAPLIHAYQNHHDSNQDIFDNDGSPVDLSMRGAIYVPALGYNERNAFERYNPPGARQPLQWQQLDYGERRLEEDGVPTLTAYSELNNEDAVEAIRQQSRSPNRRVRWPSSQDERGASSVMLASRSQDILSSEESHMDLSMHRTMRVPLFGRSERSAFEKYNSSKHTTTPLTAEQQSMQGSFLGQQQDYGERQLEENEIPFSVSSESNNEDAIEAFGQQFRSSSTRTVHWPSSQEERGASSALLANTNQDWREGSQDMSNSEGSDYGERRLEKNGIPFSVHSELNNEDAIEAFRQQARFSSTRRAHWLSSHEEQGASNALLARINQEWRESSQYITSSDGNVSFCPEFFQAFKKAMKSIVKRE